MHDVQVCSVKEILTSGVWSQLETCQSPELQRLAAATQATVISSRADATTKKYWAAFRRWKEWARFHDLPVFPVKEAHLMLYMQSVGEHTKSKSAVEEAYNAIAWAHRVGDQQAPTESAAVKLTLQGLQRQLAKPVQKKKPITAEMLASIVTDAEQSNSLADFRLATACLISYAGFLRFDELVQIKAQEIHIYDNYMTISIPRSKTDQLRSGKEVVIARTASQLCPVKAVESYLSRAGIVPSDNRPIFRPIVKTKLGEKLRDTRRLTYSRLRECFKEKLKALGFPAEQFGLHSLRAGGATAAANNGVPDRLFKRHGRWKSESAKDGYIEDSLEARISVSENLGLNRATDKL